MTIEEQIQTIVDQRLEQKIPELEQRLEQKYVFKQVNQTLFNQTEMAKKQHISVTTFRKWRKMGLECEPSPSGILQFDINKVNKWREQFEK